MLRRRAVRRVDAEEGAAIRPEDFAQRNVAGRRVACVQLDLALVLRVEQAQVLSHLVCPRVRRWHDADVDLEDRLVRGGGDGERMPLSEGAEPVVHSGALEVQVVPLHVLQRLDSFVTHRVVELQRDHVWPLRLAPKVDARERHPLVASVEDADDEAIDHVRQEAWQRPEVEDRPVEEEEGEPHDEGVVRVPKRLVVRPLHLLVRAAIDDKHADHEDFASEARRHARRPGAGCPRVPRHHRRRARVVVVTKRLVVVRRRAVVEVVRRGVAEHRDQDEVLGGRLVEDDVLVEGHHRGDPREEPRRADGGGVVQPHDERAHDGQHHHRAVEVEHLPEALRPREPHARHDVLQDRIGRRGVVRAFARVRQAVDEAEPERLAAESFALLRIRVADECLPKEDHVHHKVHAEEDLARQRVLLAPFAIQRPERVDGGVVLTPPLLGHLFLLLRGGARQELPCPLLLCRNSGGGGDREGDGGDQPVARPEDGGHQRVLRQRREEAWYAEPAVDERAHDEGGAGDDHLVPPPRAVLEEHHAATAGAGDEDADPPVGRLVADAEDRVVDIGVV
mmetsp:Transcript_7584/g.18768  ORF Transcript_7584/g.18768 Transcript_7584/m.18768 type:complete len:564 (+) Transcript_7584:1350-3041(+)